MKLSEFGRELKVLLKVRNKSVADFSLMMGSESKARRALNGKYLPNDELLNEIKTALQLDYDELKRLMIGRQKDYVRALEFCDQLALRRALSELEEERIILGDRYV